MKKIDKPSFDEEKLLWEKGFDTVIGIDEVGRGAFAGPVVAAAVVFPKTILTKSDPLLGEITDSKLLTPEKRTHLAAFITSSCLFSTISTISVSFINKKGVGNASFAAFRKVLSDTCNVFDSEKLFVLIDGFGVPYARKVNKTRQKALIKGDRRSISIAAASIIAKVYRDELMATFHAKYKHYNFLRNKGYGTKEHQEMIRKYGLSKLHRTSFNLHKFLSVLT